MAEDKISILIDTIFNDKGGKEAVKLLDGLEKKIVTSQSSLSKTAGKDTIFPFDDRAIARQKESTKELNAQNKRTVEILRDMNKEAKNAQPSSMLDRTVENLQKAGAKGGFFGKLTNYMSNFRMEMLGVMFAGMQLQRTFGGLFKDMIANYRKIANESNPLSIALTKLEANFMYLKYSIMEAMSPFLSGIIEGIANFINMLAEQDPEKLQLIGEAILGLAIAGAALFVFGQAVLFTSSLFQAITTLGTLFGAGGAGTTATAGLTALGGVLTALLLIPAAILAIALAVSELGNKSGTISALKLALSGLGEVIKGIATGDINTLAKGVMDLVDGLALGIYNIFLALLNAIGDFIIAWGAVLMSPLILLYSTIKGIISTIQGKGYWSGFKSGIDDVLVGMNTLMEAKKNFLNTASATSGTVSSVKGTTDSWVNSFFPKPEDTSAAEEKLKSMYSKGVISAKEYEDALTRINSKLAGEKGSFVTGLQDVSTTGTATFSAESPLNQGLVTTTENFNTSINKAGDLLSAVNKLNKTVTTTHRIVTVYA